MAQGQAPSALPAPPPAPAPMAPDPATEANDPVSKALATLLDQQTILIEQQKALIKLLAEKQILNAAQADQLSTSADHLATDTKRTVSEALTALQAKTAGQPKTAPGALNIPYVPDYVRNQIRDQVKQELVTEAKTEGWLAPNVLPEWTRNLKIYGDLMVRGEGDLFERENSTQILDFNTLLLAPFDLNGTIPPPTLNTTKDRDRMRLRARLGLTARVADGLAADFRLTTGNTAAPVSQNQTLGNDFNKNSIVIDRAYFRYQPGSTTTFTAGRVPNPFFTSDLVWNNEISLDGFAGQLDAHPGRGFGWFGTLGVFPLQFTDLNFPSNNAGDKADNLNKWLLAGQIGVDVQAARALDFRGGIAYYDYLNYSGQLSALCPTPTLGCPAYSTDFTRPLFTQSGNTFFGLRDLSNVPAGSPLPQVYGLASKFEVLNLNTRADWRVNGPYHVMLDFDYAVNLGYDRRAISRLPIENNFQTVNGNTVLKSGNQAYAVRLMFGRPLVTEPWQWNFTAGYKYLEPDSVVAAFNDSYFHLGGTNAKGYSLTGELGLLHNTWASLRWFSANEIFGQAYGVDVLQFDLNSQF